jgi:hypothetical protein
MPGGAPLRVVHVIKPGGYGDRHEGRSSGPSPPPNDYEIATGAAKILCVCRGASRSRIPDEVERNAIALAYVRRAEAAPVEHLKRRYQSRSKPMLTR